MTYTTNRFMSNASNFTFYHNGKSLPCQNSVSVSSKETLIHS